MSKRITCTQLIGTSLLQPSQESISRAALLIRQGGLVAFPTETVYGLGANALDSDAVAKIFQAKGRPSDNPLIVHVSDLEQVNQVAAALPARALPLIERFWPGPLSLVLPRSENISDLVSAGLSTVAVRMPSHDVALKLIAEAGVPVAAPSANSSGRPSPTKAGHVLEDLAGRIDAVIDGGPCSIGVESTVLDLSGPHPVILRPGGISCEAISHVLGEPVYATGWDNGSPPPSPGMKYRHYSPGAPLLLITGAPGRRAELIKSLVKFYRRRGMKVAILNESDPASGFGNREDLILARDLFYKLRRFDRQGADIILAQEIPSRGLGAAVMNRLRKAASRIIKA